MAVNTVQVPTEVFNLIDDFAQNPGFLPVISHLQMQEGSEFEPNAKIIADLAEKKIAKLLTVAKKKRTYKNLGGGVFALQELACVQQNFDNDKAQSLLAKSRELSKECRDYLKYRRDRLENIKNDEGLEYLAISYLTEIALIHHGFREFEAEEINFKQATELEKIIPNAHFQKCYALLKITSAYVAMGNPEKAAEFLKKAENVAYSISNVPHRCDDFTSIALAHFELGNAKQTEIFLYEAKKIAYMMRGNHKCRALFKIAKVHIKINSLQHAEDISKTIFNPKYKSDLLRKIALAYFEEENVEVFEGFLAAARESAFAIPDVENKSKSLSLVVCAYIKVGNLIEAKATADEIPDESMKDIALLKIFYRHIEMGNPTEANRVIAAIQDEELKDSALRLTRK
ncbi:MAG: hypothetical protein PVI40_00295 [Chlamydiota bacterium]|jgi:hypothetical protein